MKDIALKEQERIVRVVRRYGPTHFVSWVFGVLCISTAFFFMFWLFRHDWWGITLFVLLLLAGCIILFRTYFVWKKTVAVITTHRIIDVDQRGLLDREVSEVPHDQIEDVSGKIKGVLGTMFRFGTVRVQTGAGKVVILINRVKQPVHIQQLINEFRERYVAKYAHDFSSNVADVILDRLFELELSDLQMIEQAVQKQIKKRTRTKKE